MSTFDKRKKRMFIIEIEILEDSWGWKEGDTLRIPILSNNYTKAQMTFEDNHWGSEYPLYNIISVEDCVDYAFFTPNFKSNNLI